MAKPHKHTARVSAYTSSTDGTVTIEVDDPASGLSMLKMTLTAEQMLTRMAGRMSDEEIPCTWGRLNRIGWKRCNVTLPVRRKSDMAKVVARIVGGEWSARDGDWGNMHRRLPEGGYTVVFWGHIPGGDPEAASARIMQEFGE